MRKVVFISVCSTVPHYYDGKKLDKKMLSEITGSSSEVRLLSIDGRIVKRQFLLDVGFVRPGRHEIRLQFDWETLIPVAGLLLSQKTTNDEIDSICFDTKPGMSYSIRAEPSGKYFVMEYESKFSLAFSSKKIDIIDCK